MTSPHKSLHDLALAHYRDNDSATQYARSYGYLAGLLITLESLMEQPGVGADIILDQMRRAVETARKGLPNG